MEKKWKQKTWQAIFLDEAKHVMKKDCSALITIASELIAIEHKNLVGEIRKILRTHSHTDKNFYKEVMRDIDALEDAIQLP